MPRENRKRGKKHKKSAAQDECQEPQLHEEEDPSQHAGPSWITAAPRRPAPDDREAPFGYVDAEIKAYFKTVDLQIRDWQETSGAEAGENDADPNEDRRLFFVAALNEMSDKEKQLATDPDCSSILERMAYSMDDFARRVFADRLSGSYEQLMKHRFASHVCQTLLNVAGATISREARGVLPLSSSEVGDTGELRTMTQLVLDICEEILPVFSSLILDAFASHVIRALLLLLDPALASRFPADSQVRSKKSSTFKAKQGPLKSVFSAADPLTIVVAPDARPQGFRAAAARFVSHLRDKLDENEVRALTASQVASPVLQLLLELEASEGLSSEPASLMDSVLAGLITTLNADQHAVIEASDYVGTLLRDATSSHLLETIVSRSPMPVFERMWSTYFSSKLAKLAVHPVANFVVAKAILRLTTEQLREASQELENVASKILSAARLGVLRSIVERVSVLGDEVNVTVQMVRRAFEFENDDDVVPAVLRLLPLPQYKAARANDVREETGKSKQSQNRKDDPLEPKTQGAVLLQSLLSLPTPHNQFVIDSILAQELDELLAMSCHVTSSRVFDALLDSSTVPVKVKRQFVLKFLGHFHTLVDDRIGSRVGDRCWDSADPYLKEKIARSLIPHEQFLAGSFYGKFFARRLNLHLLRKDKDKWKDLQSSNKAAPSATSSHVLPSQPPVGDSGNVSQSPASAVRDSEKRKRPTQGEDEIDRLFSATLGSKTKRAELNSQQPEPAKDEALPKAKKVKTKTSDTDGHDKVLDEVFGAIKSAPKSDVRSGKKKRLK